MTLSVYEQTGNVFTVNEGSAGKWTVMNKHLKHATFPKNNYILSNFLKV